VVGVAAAEQRQGSHLLHRRVHLRLGLLKGVVRIVVVVVVHVARVARHIVAGAWTPSRVTQKSHMEGITPEERLASKATKERRKRRPKAPVVVLLRHQRYIGGGRA